MTVNEIAAVLGCSRAAASLLRTGSYPCGRSALAVQYRALLELVARNARTPSPQDAANALCAACDRDECAGCRCLEIEFYTARRGNAAPYQVDF